jgi:hypothetical protein
MAENIYCRYLGGAMEYLIIVAMLFVISYFAGKRIDKKD